VARVKAMSKKIYINIQKSVPLFIGEKLCKCGDMLQYFQDNPNKLEEKLERDKKKDNK